MAVANQESNRYVFPLDLDGRSHTGHDNLSQPFVKLTFYNWQSQNVELQETQLQKEIVAQFFLAMPSDQNLAESFDHQWDTTIDWTNISNSLLSKGLSYLKSSIQSKSSTIDFAVDAASAMQGKKRNDFVAEVYENIDFRRFEFNFNLVPRSKEEAATITKICDKLKDITTPAYESILIFPSVCEATAVAGNGKILFRTMISGVQNLTFNYTPQSFMRTFMDGEPTSMQISLSIKELRRVNKAKAGII